MTDAMPSNSPMSIAFLCAAAEARVSRSAVLRQRYFFPDDADGGPDPSASRRGSPGRSGWRNWPTAARWCRPAPRSTSATKCSCRTPAHPASSPPRGSWPRSTAPPGRITKEWLITWDGSRPSAPADAPLLEAQLPPEWFAGRLLRWIHETAGTSSVVVDLAGFGEHDVPLDSVVTLAEHLASDGLVTVDSSGERATATLTRGRRRRRRAGGRRPRRLLGSAPRRCASA